MTTLYEYAALQKENTELKKHLKGIIEILIGGGYEEMVWQDMIDYCEKIPLIFEVEREYKINEEMFE